MQAVWTRWVCACCAWQLKQPNFFPEVYCNQFPLKFLIGHLITPILLKRFYCSRGWGFLSPLRQQNSLLPWRNPSLILPSSASSSMLPSPSGAKFGSWLTSWRAEWTHQSSGKPCWLPACWGGSSQQVDRGSTRSNEGGWSWWFRVRRGNMANPLGHCEL